MKFRCIMCRSDFEAESVDAPCPRCKLNALTPVQRLCAAVDAYMERIARDYTVPQPTAAIMSVEDYRDLILSREFDFEWSTRSSLHGLKIYTANPRSPGLPPVPITII